MKYNFLISIAVAAFSLILFTHCSEEDDNNSENWAAAVAGTYTGTGDNALTNNPSAVTTIITRISDKVLNFQFTYQGDTYCMDSVTLNSATTFSISEFDGCANESRTGAGNFNGNNVSYTICCYAASYQVTINGSK